MNEQEVRRIVEQVLSEREVAEQREIIASDDFRALRGDLAEKFQVSGEPFLWENPFMEEKLCKLVRLGYYKEHPRWPQARHTLINDIRTNLRAA